MEESDRIALVAEVAGSYLRRNSVGVDQIGRVVSAITRAFEHVASGNGIGDGGTPEVANGSPQARPEKPTPAVPIKRSVQPDYIVCLEDGFHARTLKRHLQSAHGMSPAEYRAKWGLPRDYPVTAPAYSERRSALAKKLGLGNKAGGAAKASKGKRASKRSA
jgi:predicted transcriptional regulator